VFIKLLLIKFKIRLQLLYSIILDKF